MIGHQMSIFILKCIKWKFYFSFYVKDLGIYSLHVYSLILLYLKGELDCNEGYYSFDYEGICNHQIIHELKSVGKVVASKQFKVELSN